MSKSVIFITGNEGKWRTANEILKNYDINLTHQKVETPEIQSIEVDDVAKFSAVYACKKLKTNVFVTDVGYYIEAMNGFPGPFIKYINCWLSSQNLLDLMVNKTNRNMIVKETVAYAEPGKEPVIFSSKFTAQIASTAARGGSTIDQLMILPGFDKPKGACNPKEIQYFWNTNLKHYYNLGKYLEKN